MNVSTKRFCALVLFLFVSLIGFSQPSKTNLIIGSWLMDGKEFVAQMSLKFKKDSCILERLINNKATLTVQYKYNFSQDEQYLHLNPTNPKEKKWKIKIIQLDAFNLKLQNQSPDSAALILHRVKE